MDKYQQYENNRRTVLEGLKRRSDRMDAYEMDMITACNKNAAEAKERREREAAAMNAQARQQAARSAKVQAKIYAQHKAEKQERDAKRAFRLYCLCVIGFLWLTTWTYFPIWAAILTSLCLGVFLMAYIYRVFVPFDEGQEAGYECQ